MTQWVETPRGGRARGPTGLVRAWAEVLVRPRQFFRVGVAPGDQGPGLAFAAVVVLVEEATRFALVAGAAPVFAGRPLASAALALAIAVVLITPAVLHLTAALETILLAALTWLADFAPDRGGVSETVQVLAYAAAPCVLAGLPVPGIRVLCAGYGSVLLVVGLAEVHDLTVPRAVVAALPAAVLVFGYGFRAFGAGATLLGL
ncbi:MAG: YIP1 family protein [Haloarculaceae archaeon]